MNRLYETEFEVAYSIDDLNLIDDRFMSAIVPIDKQARILWPATTATNKFLESLYEKYFVQIGVVHEGNRNRSFQMLGNDDRDLVSLSTDEAKSVVLGTFDLCFAGVWQSEIPKAMIEDFRTQLNAVTDVNTAKFAFRNDQLDGCVILASLEMFDGRQMDHIAWIWVKRRLERQHRSEVFSSLTNWVLKSAKTDIVAGIYPRNGRSVALARSFGFKSFCATLRKLE